MTAPLDPKFAKVVALMRSTQHEGERVSASARAETMAAAAGMSLEEAISMAEASAASPFVNIMSSFDDAMEREEPGWKARRAAEKTEAERQRRERRAALLESYGSEEAALAPCRQEQLLRDAIGGLRNPQDAPFERWTHDVDGYWSVYGDPPAHVLHLIKHAYPMPATFAAAMAEHDYWQAREQEIEDVLGPDNYGDSGLDLIPGMRFELVRDLFEHKLEATTLQELYKRFKFYREMESHRDEIESAVFRDLETLVRRKHLSDSSADLLDNVQDVTIAASPEFSPDLAETPLGNPSTRDGQIQAALDADPSRSDRLIARTVGCSPTTVGKVRRNMGLHDTARSVHRGGQHYQMHVDFDGRSEKAGDRHSEPTGAQL